MTKGWLALGSVVWLVGCDASMTVPQDTGWTGGGAVTGPPGPEGPAGPEGPEGPAGPQGPEGPMGPEGPQGPEGPMGPAGPQGEKGDPGAAGPAGPQGPTGPQGPQGPIGATGAQGPAGPEGPSGPVGPAGPAGPQGPRGFDGVDGADGLDGLPQSKLDLYVVEVDALLGTSTQLDLEASCADSNDILLNGGCETGDSAVRLTESYGRNQLTENQTAYWHCGFAYDTSGLASPFPLSLGVTTLVFCIDIP